jgi:hypothetical protein
MDARDIYEDLLRFASDLKALGMRRQPCVADLLLLRYVYSSDRPFAVADQKATGIGIKSNIIGVAAEIDPTGNAVVGAAKKPHRSVAGIGDVDRVIGGHVANTLRFRQAVDGPSLLARRKIDYADAVVAQFGNEQTPPRHIDRHVINTPPYRAERNLGIKPQWLRIRTGPCGSCYSWLLEGGQ